MFNLLARYSFAILLVAQSTLTLYGSSDEMLLFSTTGKACIKRDTMRICQLQGEKLLPGDLLEIVNGTVTIISRENKRTTIDKPGKFTFSQVRKRMDLAEASPSIRYFVIVWENMQHQKKFINKPGGVIRGENEDLLPSDSIIVLSDSITFFSKNPPNISLTLVIRSATVSKPIQFTFNDSTMRLGINQIFQRTPGKYTWEISDGFRKPVRRSLFIPFEADRQRMIMEYNSFILSLDNLDGKTMEMLRFTYKLINRIYLE
jgi:hypothetical protein